MKPILGVLLIVAGVVFGFWAGVWWAFIGGIMDVITEVRAPELSTTNLAFGVAKIVFAGTIGYVAAIVHLWARAL